MPAILPLAEFGERIVILGPSNAGKSTLAEAISGATGLPAIHLDRFRFLENSDWQERPDEEFKRLHDEAVASARWVMEGNYSKLYPTRFARATGAIVLWDNRWRRMGRYLLRTFGFKPRAGMLEGGRDSLKWSMVKWVFIVSARRPQRYPETARSIGVPMVYCRSARELNALYDAWALTRP
ncbi:hypothetical protein GCM10007989_04090 [Devosia pacifica]|uniref:AAA family ATPase n=1 Tax=Devosia pacifica TaxID=1335967 RepID=A0A918RU02_9HYPH|nr:AAA family ATPase [Devosia pacifica]GHA12747.1 hypothetical protein GCM10007989_04090 [Devosia pacifica]